MKNKYFVFLSLLATTVVANAQTEYQTPNFFSDVRFGGGLGLSFGSGYSNVLIAPSAIKPVNEQLSLGVGLQFNYLGAKNLYSTTSYGANFLALYNPIPELQLSADLEQLRVHYSSNGDSFYNNTSKYKKDFWNTGLFLGIGYTSGNATVGVKYNVLYKDNDYVYNQAWLPFVRVYF